MSIFALPDLGEGLQEAEIVAWHVAPGDHVVADQPLVSVETEKAVVEVPAPRSGRIARLHAAVGDRVKVGAPLVAYEEGPPQDSGTVVGALPAAAPAAPAASPAAESPTAAPTAAPTADPAIAAMPAARARARELGLDLAAIVGTGPGGVVTGPDVEAAARQAPPQGEPLRGVRLAMARNMAAARDAVQPATLTDDADVTAWPDGTEPTMRLVRAVAAGCAVSPALNAWLDGARLTRQVHRHIDVGIAVETAEGLFVPVLRDAGGRGLPALRTEFEALKAALHERSIPPAALRGATISLSNFGALGGRYATLSVIPPQVAILGAGRIAPRPAVHGGALAIRRLLPLSLTFDHRAATGAEAARFLAAARADLERAD